MRFAYADTSALAKLFWREEGTELVISALDNVEVIATVSLAYVELISATFRAARRGDMPREDIPRVLSAIRNNWNDYVSITVDETLIEDAAALAERHVIRAYDSVHLAAGLRWQRNVGERVTFLAFDRELAKAAQAEGLEVIPLPPGDQGKSL